MKKTNIRLDAIFCYTPDEIHYLESAYKNISIQMFYVLRDHYRETYGGDLYSITVYFSGTKNRCDILCDDSEDETYTNPIAFYERYGW